jgi:hypothetical protein
MISSRRSPSSALNSCLQKPLSFACSQSAYWMINKTPLCNSLVGALCCSLSDLVLKFRSKYLKLCYFYVLFLLFDCCALLSVTGTQVLVFWMPSLSYLFPISQFFSLLDWLLDSWRVNSALFPRPVYLWIVTDLLKFYSEILGGLIPKRNGTLWGIKLMKAHAMFTTTNLAFCNIFLVTKEEFVVDLWRFL